MASSQQSPQPKPGQNAGKPGEGPKPAETKPAEASASPKPGEASKPAEGAATGSPDAAPGTDDKEEKARGITPQMPACLVWKEASGVVVANLIHPRTEQIFAVRGKGVNGTMGTLGDEGYPLGGLRQDVPKWILKHLPAGATLLGYAPVLGFPLPTQTP